VTAEIPHLDQRRQEQLFAELQSRARALLPGVKPAHPRHDWLRALFGIAARIETEVTRRLDRVPEKNRRNFFDWLGMRGRAARAARLVAVFRRTAPAPGQELPPLPVGPRVRLQAQTETAPVTFETEQDLSIFAGSVSKLVAVQDDKIFLSPPGLFAPRASPPNSIPRRLKSLTPRGSGQVQISPAVGLEASDIIAIDRQQYRVKEVKEDLVTIEPPLLAETSEASVEVVASFAPFAGPRERPQPHNWQEHTLYIGDNDLLNIEAAAEITVLSEQLLAGAEWAYFGKIKPQANAQNGATEPAGNGSADASAGIANADLPDWHPLTPALDKDGHVVLTKPEGPFEPFEVKGEKMRVLRARRPLSPSTLRTRAIALRIKSQTELAQLQQNRTGNPPAGDGDDSDACTRGVDFEAIANTVPISFLRDFLPLGQVPRLFDAFYIGCAEAFSKRGADVTLNFKMAGATLGPLAAARRSDSVSWLFGVGTDGIVYSLSVKRGAPDAAPSLAWKAFNRPRDRLAAAGTTTQATGDRIISFASKQPPAVITRDNTTSIAAAAGLEVWFLPNVSEDASGAPDTSKEWIWLGPVEKSGEGETKILAATDAGNAAVSATALLVKNGALTALAVRNGETKGGLYQQQIADPPTRKWTTIIEGPDLEFVAPFRNISDATTAEFSHGILYTRTADSPQKNEKKRELWAWMGNGAQINITGEKALDSKTIPLGIRVNDNRSYVAAVIMERAGRSILLSRIDNDHSTEYATLPLGDLSVEPSLAFVPVAKDDPPAIVFLAGPDGNPPQLVVWKPKQWDEEEAIWIGPAPGGGSFAEGVVPFGNGGGLGLAHVVAPGTSADAFAGAVVPVEFKRTPTQLSNCVVTQAVQPTVHRLELRPENQTPVVHQVTRAIALKNGKAAYLLASKAEPASGDFTCELFQLSPAPEHPAFGGTRISPRKLQLGTNDAEADKDKVLKFGNDDQDKSYTIYQVNQTEGYAVFQTDLPGADGQQLEYRYWNSVLQDAAAVRPLLWLDGLPDDVKSRILSGTIIFAPGATPAWQRALSQTTPAPDAPAVLAQAWTIEPQPEPSSGLLRFEMAAGGFRAWSWNPYAATSNPELSWEYWNGTGWWKLGVADGTGHLLNNGKITFPVPGDLQPTEVLGKSNVWIRARLIGGSFGEESFKVHTTGSTTDQTQTIQRSTENVHAPRVLCLSISYEIKEAKHPAYVITYDNLAWRDQSDANRSPTAVLDLFQPFREALAKPKKSAAAPAPPEHRCCEEDATEEADEPGHDGCCAPTPTGDAGSSELALFIASDAPLDGAGARLFWDVEEWLRGAKLRVQALGKGTFVDVGVYDATDGLAQSGLLTLTFYQRTVLTELFGEPRHWLRITADDARWNPIVNGVFLNAVWAEAAETQELEILGSSDGAPEQKVALARPPVIEGSLELRVREPLMEEQIAQLRRGEPNAVRDDIADKPGAWVRWKQVADPLDHGPDERVYALDEQTGEIRFGDALHGAVPPRGRDNIAALAYKHAFGAAGNGVAAGAALQLVSPLPGVEGAVAATTGAGGADTATADETLRHAPASLWHRQRAISSRDLEQVALASAPEIVQARCVSGRTGIRLIVAIDGRDPRPGRAACHALRDRLRAAAGPSLADAVRFRVEAPRLRPLRVMVRLTVTSLERAGAVEAAARSKIRELLHWASGGFDRRGWPLGVVPTEADLAAVLIDIPDVLGIGKVALFDAEAPEGTLFPSRVPQDTLVTLAAEDGARINPPEEDEA